MGFEPKRALVLAGESSDDLALIACQSLGRLGLRASVGALESSGTLLRASRWCESVSRVAGSRVETEEADGEAERLARETGADVVFAADVPSSLCVARLRARRTSLAFFPAPDEATTRLMDDKWSFYRFLLKHGLPTPRTWLIEEAAQAASLPMPVVLKPLNMSAGLGVGVARTAAERDALLAGGDEHLRLPVLAQEYVEGQDVDLSFLAERGKLNAWIVQTRRPDGTIDYIDDERVVALGRRIAEASNYTGLVHVDMRYEGPERSAIKIIECNPRVWASLPLAEGLGADFIGRGLDMAAGRARPVQSGTPTGSCGSLRGVLLRAATGRALSPCESAYLRGAASDPLPLAVRGLRRLAGLKGGG